MKRKEFIRSIGAAGLFAGLTGFKPTGLKPPVPDCALIPSETAGPFPLDLTENTFYLRQDVREDRIGAPLNLQMRILGVDNCEPMPNVRVNIWHCDNEGNYSGYGTEAGLTYLRGYQMTDANGVVNFTTIVPGWYPGRVCHIHFQVYVNSAYAAISQLTFDPLAVDQVYADNPSLYPDGADPLTPDTDGLFADGYALQLATLDEDSAAGSYVSALEVTVDGVGTPTGYQEQMAVEQFELGQNSPNPFTEVTRIPLQLHSPASVRMEIWSVDGRKLYEKDYGRLTAGAHAFALDFNQLGIPAASYLYQFTVENEAGKFAAVKRMTTL